MPPRSLQWHAILETAAKIVAALPYENVGQCVLRHGELFRGDDTDLQAALAHGEIHFHMGSIRGTFPQIV